MASKITNTDEMETKIESPYKTYSNGITSKTKINK